MCTEFVVQPYPPSFRSPSPGPCCATPLTWRRRLAHGGWNIYGCVRTHSNSMPRERDAHLSRMVIANRKRVGKKLFQHNWIKTLLFRMRVHCLCSYNYHQFPIKLNIELIVLDIVLCTIVQVHIYFIGRLGSNIVCKCVRMWCAIISIKLCNYVVLGNWFWMLTFRRAKMHAVRI